MVFISKGAHKYSLLTFPQYLNVTSLFFSQRDAMMAEKERGVGSSGGSEGGMRWQVG